MCVCGCVFVRLCACDDVLKILMMCGCVVVCLCGCVHVMMYMIAISCFRSGHLIAINKFCVKGMWCISCVKVCGVYLYGFHREILTTQPCSIFPALHAHSTGVRSITVC